GNILMIAWELKTAAQARQAGYNRSIALWPDHIIEVQPVGTNGGNIVWEWHAWDHLIQDYDPTKDNYGVVADHPELFDINMPAGVGPQGGDWMHVNGISYNPERDEIAFSSHTLDEIYVIDHSTTTEEAAGHTGGNRGRGGDILYRWGKPSNYRVPGAQYFNVVHCAIWIPAGLPGGGHLMAFNNREGQPTSQIVELNPPFDGEGNYVLIPGSAYGPATPFWSYSATGFYSNHLGSCQRLPNGNTMISEATSGFLFEVDMAGVTQWSYARGGQIPRVLRYALDYPGLYVLNPVAAGELVINELLADNGTTAPDQDGEYDDWIEFYNNTNHDISVWGFGLSDDAQNPTKWRFPDTTLAAGSYLIVWADADTNQNGLHASFELPAEAGRIRFCAPNLTILDSISYGQQTTDRSFGRYPNGMGEFILMTPTFAAENIGGDPIEVVINEILAMNDTTAADQDQEFDPWIELFNNGDAALSLAGFYLSNDAADPTRWAFPDTSIPGRGYLIVWVDGDVEQSGLHANFELAVTAGRALLCTPNQILLDEAEWGEQVSDVSFGRYPNGTGGFIPMIPTFAAENDSVGLSSVADRTETPGKYFLSPSYPNPFNSSTVIAFQLASPGDVSLTIHNLLGQRVAVLMEGWRLAGHHETTWSGTDDRGSPVNSGVYFVTLRTGDFTQTRKTVLLK
ncbi:lamin tail domain-containing protein, partial [bacterium]|nr:lamin tail domain-containing protein [bacterium]